MRALSVLFVCLLAAGRLAWALPPAPAYPGPDGAVTLLAAQANGGVLVGGRFTRFAGRPRPGGLVRLRPDGRLDSAFALPAAWAAYAGLHPRALAPLPDGRVLAAFTFVVPSCPGCPPGSSRDFLVRLRADGRPDATFVSAVLPPPDPRSPLPASEMSISSLAVQPDGCPVLGGTFWGPEADTLHSLRRVVRLRPDGRRDAQFEAGTYPPQGVDLLAVRPDGRIALTHCCRQLIECPQPDGCPDPAFAVRCLPGQPGGQPLDWEGGTPGVLLVAPDGTLLVGGAESAPHPTDPARSLVRLLPSGHRDPAFGPVRGPDEAGISALARQADGRLLAAYQRYRGSGNYSADSPYLRSPQTAPAYLADWRAEQAHVQAVQARWQWVWRWLPTGQPDPGFHPGEQAPSGEVRALAVLPDGRILLGGDFTCYDGADTPFLSCLRPDGQPDPTFVR